MILSFFKFAICFWIQFEFFTFEIRIKFSTNFISWFNFFTKKCLFNTLFINQQIQNLFAMLKVIKLRSWSIFWAFDMIRKISKNSFVSFFMMFEIMSLNSLNANISFWNWASSSTLINFDWNFFCSFFDFVLMTSRFAKISTRKNNCWNNDVCLNAARIKWIAIEKKFEKKTFYKFFC